LSSFPDFSRVIFSVVPGIHGLFLAICTIDEAASKLLQTLRRSKRTRKSRQVSNSFRLECERVKYIQVASDYIAKVESPMKLRFRSVSANRRREEFFMRRKMLPYLAIGVMITSIAGCNAKEGGGERKRSLSPRACEDEDLARQEMRR
jgi:hypothetical protein